MKAYLKATNREAVADLADGVAKDLRADPEVLANPEKYFDRVIELNLSELKPLINGPLSPDAAMELDRVGDTLAKKNLPENIEVALVGSCTNSSYEDFTRAASIVKQCLDKGVKIKTPLIVVPGSVRIRETLKRDGILQQFEKLNATVMTTACGPCIGQWDRHIGDKTKVNTIIESFNRNFAGRNDGSKKTQAFLASPEIVVAMAINGDMRFNPLTSTVTGANGVSFKLATGGRRASREGLRHERRRLHHPGLQAGPSCGGSERRTYPPPHPVPGLERQGLRRSPAPHQGEGQVHDGPHLPRGQVASVPRQHRPDLG